MHVRGRRRAAGSGTTEVDRPRHDRLCAATPWILFACLMGALIPCALLIFPRPHYVVAAWTVGLVLITIGVSRRIPQLSANRSFGPLFLKATGVVVLAMILTPRRDQAPHSTVERGKEMTIVKTAVSLRPLNVQQPLRILRSELGLERYVGNNVEGIEVSDSMAFLELLHQERIDVIVDEPGLRDDLRLASDAGFRNFVEDPSRFGFASTTIAGTPRRLLVKRELVERLSPQQQLAYDEITDPGLRTGDGKIHDSKSIR